MRVAKFLSTPIPAGLAMPEPYRQLCVLEPALEDLWGYAIYCARHWAGYPVQRRRGRQADWQVIRIELFRLLGPGRPDHDDILGSIPAYECAALALRAALGMET